MELAKPLLASAPIVAKRGASRAKESSCEAVALRARRGYDASHLYREVSPIAAFELARWEVSSVDMRDACAPDRA
jgi:hypothetical protein